MTAALALTVVVLALPATAAARPSQSILFEAPGEVLADDAALRAQTLQEIRDLGVRRLRIIVYWDSVAPSPDARQRPGFPERDPAAYHWGRYARAVDEARAHGLRVLLTLSGPVPRWATRSKGNRRSYPSAKRFARFVTAAGRRFHDQVDMWSVWNEPNHPKFLLPQYRKPRGAVSGRIYRQLSSPPTAACAPRATGATGC